MTPAGIEITRASGSKVEPVSHQKQLCKRVIISKGLIPGLLQLATAELQTGDHIGEHAHVSMIEVFHVIQGEILLSSGHFRENLQTGDSFVVFPPTPHGISVLQSTKLIYFGIENKDTS